MAVVKMSGKADLASPYIQAVPMADPEDANFVGRECVITGWGKTSGEWTVLTKQQYKYKYTTDFVEHVISDSLRMNFISCLPV